MSERNVIGKISFGSQEVTIIEEGSSPNEKMESQLHFKLSKDDRGKLEKIVPQIRSGIALRRWWISDYWLAKGVPNEQINFSDNNRQLMLYNYWKNLSSKHLDEIVKVLDIFSKIRQGLVFEQIHYLVIDNEQPLNDKSGKLLNGENLRGRKAVVLYPSAFLPTLHRVTEKVTNLTGTVAHELTHPFAEMFLDNQDTLQAEWERVGAWRSVESKGRKLPGVDWFLTHETDEPENVITDYGLTHPYEDLADSHVARLFEPEKLVPKKLELLRRRLPIEKEEFSAWSFDRRSPVILPSLDQIVIVKFIEMGFTPKAFRRRR